MRLFLDGASTSRRVKRVKPSSSPANGLVEVFTAATPSFISAGKGTSSVRNEVQLTPSWLTDA